MCPMFVRISLWLGTVLGKLEQHRKMYIILALMELIVVREFRCQLPSWVIIFLGQWKVMSFGE
jgi:hypothetical protein